MVTPLVACRQSLRRPIASTQIASNPTLPALSAQASSVAGDPRRPKVAAWVPLRAQRAARARRPCRVVPRSGQPKSHARRLRSGRPPRRPPPLSAIARCLRTKMRATYTHSAFWEGATGPARRSIALSFGKWALFGSRSQRNVRTAFRAGHPLVLSFQAPLPGVAERSARGGRCAR
jgi:hypothetical protein